MLRIIIELANTTARAIIIRRHNENRSTTNQPTERRMKRNQSCSMFACARTPTGGWVGGRHHLIHIYLRLYNIQNAVRAHAVHVRALAHTLNRQSIGHWSGRGARETGRDRTDRQVGGWMVGWMVLGLGLGGGIRNWSKQRNKQKDKKTIYDTHTHRDRERERKE